MANRPLDQRLDQLTQDTAELEQRVDLASAPTSSPLETATIPEIPPEVEMADGVQVAGGRMEVIGEVLRRVKKTDIRPELKPLSPEAASAAATSDFEKAATQAGIGMPTESRIAGKIEQIKATTPTPEQIIARRPAVSELIGEKPPKAPFNMPLIDTEDSVKETMLVLAEGVRKERGTFAGWQEAAEAAGFGPKFIDDLTSGKLQVDPKNTILAAEAHIGVLQSLNGLTKKIADGTATPTEIAEATQIAAFGNLIQQSAAGYITNLAQSMAVLRMPRQNGKEISAILEQFGSDTDIVKFAQAYQDLNTPEAKAALVRSFAQGNPWEKMFGVYVNGLLSRPGTQIKNFLSNTLFIPYRMAERGIAAGVGKLRSAVGLGADDVYQFAEVPSMLASSPTAVRNGWELAKHAFSAGVPKGWQDPTKIARQQARMELFNYKADDSLLSAGMKGLNYAVTFPGRMLMTSDEFFKGINYTYELSAEATRAGVVAYDEALRAGMSAEDAIKAQAAAVDKFLLEPPEYIAGLAETGTFTQRLTGSMGELQAMTTPNSAAKFAFRTQMPFISTPVNVIGETIARTPFGIFTRPFWDAVKAGGKEADMAVTKVGLGSAALYTFTEFSTSGMVTGSGPGEKGNREAMVRQGWQPYSIVLDFDGTDEEVRQALSKFPTSVTYGSGDYAGKVFVSYQGMEPVGALMAMAADYADYARYEQDDSRLNAYVGGAAFGLMNYIMESPFLQGVSNMASLLGGNVPNTRQNLIRQINGLAEFATTAALKTFQPLSGSATSIKEQVDPYRRDYQMNPNAPAGLKGVLDALNKHRANTPGLSEDLPPVLNLFAEPVEHEYAWSPLRMRGGKNEELNQALIQLHPNLTMPTRTASMDVQTKPGAKPISANTNLDAREYNKMLEIANEKLKLQDNLMNVVKFVQRDGGRNSLYHYQNLLDKVKNETFESARKILLEDPEFGPAIKERINEKATRLEEFGKGAR